MTVRELIGQWVTLGQSLWLFEETGAAGIPRAIAGKLFRSGPDRLAFRTPTGGICYFLDIRGFRMEMQATTAGVPFGPEMQFAPDGRPLNALGRLVPGAADGWPPNTPHEPVYRAPAAPQQ